MKNPIKNIALSAIVAIIVSVSVFHGVPQNNEGRVDVSVIPVTCASVFAASIVGTISTIFVTAVAIFTSAIVVFAATIIIITATADIVTITATFSTFAATAITVFAVFAVSQKLNIPDKWVISIYAVEMATLTIVFLYATPIASVAGIIAGCGVIAGIWYLYNRKHMPALVGSE